MLPKRPDPIHLDQQQWDETIAPWRRYVAAHHIASAFFLAMVVSFGPPLVHSPWWIAVDCLAGYVSARWTIRAVDSLWDGR